MREGYAIFRVRGTKKGGVGSTIVDFAKSPQEAEEKLAKYKKKSPRGNFKPARLTRFARRPRRKYD